MTPTNQIRSVEEMRKQVRKDYTLPPAWSEDEDYLQIYADWYHAQFKPEPLVEALEKVKSITETEKNESIRLSLINDITTEALSNYQKQK